MRGAAVLIKRVRVVGSDQASADVRIVDGMITEVGPELSVGPEESIDADGRWAIPGLWDAHVHFTQWARSRQRLDLVSTDGPASVLARVAAEAASRTDPRSVIIGFGFRTAAWDRPGTTTELDAVSGDHPVVLISGDVHCGWLNSAAARALGLTTSQGLIAERPWFSVMPAATRLAESPASLPAAIASAAQAASARGVVGVNDFEMTDGWHSWPQWHAERLSHLRVRTAVYPDRLDEVLHQGWRSGGPLTDDGMITMGPLKIISDGSLNTRTAFCHAPYADDPGGGRGQLNYPPDQLRELLTTAHDHGLEVALHAIGDAAIGVGLDTFGATGASGSIEHAQLIDFADVARMAELGIVASVQPAHLLDDRDVTQRCWPDRSDRCFALRTMLERGVRLALGSDAPVSPLDPWLAMAAAVHRSADGRPPWNPAEAITPAEALAASTDGQQVRVGDRGDLVLLDADPLAPADGSARSAAVLRSAPVTATILGGRVVYER